MKEQHRTLLEFSNDKKKVFFVGAGISVNWPTRFPVASTLIAKILEALAPNRSSLELLTELADSVRDNKRNPGDYIRFELLVDIIKQLVDPQLCLLGFIDIFTEPNALHNVLARRAIAGDVIVTTNFDGLIEESIRRLGGKPVSICTISDFKSWKNIGSDRTPVYKIHGSYRRYDGPSAELSVETVQATLSSLTLATTDFVLPEAKRNFLIEVTRGASVIVGGYSGGDDLDVMPTFKFLSPYSLLWLSHNSGCISLRDVTQERLSLLQDRSDTELASRDQFLKAQLVEKSYSVQICEVNTPTFLSNQFVEQCEPVATAEDFSSEAKLDDFLADWQAQYLSEPHIKYLILGQILFSLTRFEEAYQSYLDAWTSLEPANQALESAHIARMLSRIGVETNRFSEAEEWGKKALDIMIAAGSRSGTAQALQQYGWAHYKLGKLDEALHLYEKANAVCREENLDRYLSYVIHDTAVIYQALARYREAIPLFTESIDLSTRDGDIRHVMFSFHQLGTAHYDLGEFSQAREYHLKAMDIARVIGDFAQIDNSEHELGMLDFLSGRLADSICRFKRGIHIAKKTGRLEFVPMDLQHIGIAFMEGDKLGAADRHLHEAKAGYEAIGDEITLSELQCYLAEYYLMTGGVRALGAAQAGYEIASRKGAREYQTRGKFMVGLVLHLNGEHADGQSKIAEGIHIAKSEEFMALLLDELYLCAKFAVKGVRVEEFSNLVRWAISVYSESGNVLRRQRLESYLLDLSQQS